MRKQNVIRTNTRDHFASVGKLGKRLAYTASIVDVIRNAIFERQCGIFHNFVPSPIFIFLTRHCSARVIGNIQDRNKKL